MIQDEIKHSIEETLQTIVAQHQVELVHFVLKHRGKVLIVDVLVDKLHGGISMDEVMTVNRSVVNALEEKADLIGQEYVVEVASPGIDYPLKRYKDFLRVKNRPVRFHLREKINEKLEHVGIVQDITEQWVAIDKKGIIIKIPYKMITKAVQMLPDNY